jgi:hypothetical protein
MYWKGEKERLRIVPSPSEIDRYTEMEGNVSEIEPYIQSGDLHKRRNAVTQTRNFASERHWQTKRSLKRDKAADEIISAAQNYYERNEERDQSFTAFHEGPNAETAEKW